METDWKHRHSKHIVRWLVLTAMFFWGMDSAQALDPSQPPGSNFDLSHWYLQLPTINGVLTGTAGTVDSASASQLVAGFTNAYFYTGADGAMTFWAPDDGATTSGSTHPRSELREQLIPGNDNTNWTLYGTHIMTAQCKVLQVPADTGKVCLGQIHEPNTQPNGSTSANNEQMILFDLPNQKIYANVNLDGNLSSSFSKTLVSGSSVALNSTINYTMSVVNGVLTIIVNNVTNSWNLFSGTNYQGHIAQNWDTASGNTVYFKAGDYNQTDNTCGCSTDGALVAFYSLTRYHAACITNPPASLAVIAGTNATFIVGASGNGLLSYQWWFNATNSLASATNASLTLTNVAGANAGNYTVVVSDSTSSFSSITSAVAKLTVNLPPAITNQPTNQVVSAGNNATFTVGVNGTAPLTNYWWFNTNNILSWATGNSLTITNAQNTNAGCYFVVVNNKYGAVTSAVAMLIIQLPPAIASVLTSNQTFWINFTGTSLSSYLVQAKTNLPDPVWQTIGTNSTDGNGFSIFIDTSCTNYSSRFYRLATP